MTEKEEGEVVIRSRLGEHGRKMWLCVAELSIAPNTLQDRLLDIDNLAKVNTLERTSVAQCTAGDDGSVGIISCMSIFSACFGLLTSRQLAATTWSGQIWISC